MASSTLRLDQLVPLNVCAAREEGGGEWSLLLWVGQTSWWAGSEIPLIKCDMNEGEGDA